MMNVFDIQLHCGGGSIIGQFAKPALSHPPSAGNNNKNP